MRYQSSNTKQFFDINFSVGTDKLYLCPECSKTRKKHNHKTLKYFAKENRGYCYHCNTTFFEYKPYEKKEYVMPEWKNKTDLTDRAVKWFESRMISQKTLLKMKVYSDNEYMPQPNKETEVICFPYFRDGELINIKYRGELKSFKQYSGSELVFWNIDCLKDAKECLICEGEMDALTYIEVGFENTLSVPNGANGNLDFLNIDIFKPIDKILISADNDSKGIELRDELIRRLGIEKCFIVNLKECKDANEFILKYSGLELQDAIKDAKRLPVKGVVDVEHIYNDLVDLFETGMKPGLKIGNDEVDKFCTWETGKLVVVTGEPGMGKSEFVDYIVCKLNIMYGWKAAYFTPENYPLKYHYAKIYEKIIGKQFRKYNNDIEFDMAYEHISKNYFYILNEDDLTPESVLKSAKYLVAKEGIKILVVDPYNKLDHQYGNNLSETQYVSKFLDILTNFCRFYDVLLFLIAHPTKLAPGQIASLYTISGSAHFYNKTDYGFTFVRLRDDDNILTNESQIHWQKFRFKHLGQHGISNLKYNYNNGRFEYINSDVNHWDNSNWLIKDDNNLFENNNDFETTETDEVPF